MNDSISKFAGLPSVGQLVIGFLKRQKVSRSEDYAERREIRQARGETLQASVWGSEAGNCSRKIGFRLADIAETNPAPATGMLAFWVGDQMHFMIQAEMVAAYPNARAEVRWEHRGVSGRADAVYESPENGLVVMVQTERLLR